MSVWAKTGEPVDWMSSNFQGRLPVEHMNIKAESHLVTPPTVGVTGTKNVKKKKKKKKNIYIYIYIYNKVL